MTGYSGIYIKIKYDESVELVGTYDPFNKSNYFYTGEIPDSNFLKWNDESGILNVDEEAKVNYNVQNIRNFRDEILNDCDWVSIRYADSGGAPEAWRSFRQELRDLPDQYVQSGTIDINYQQVSGVYYNDLISRTGELIIK